MARVCLVARLDRSGVGLSEGCVLSAAPPRHASPRREPGEAEHDGERDRRRGPVAPGGAVLYDVGLPLMMEVGALLAIVIFDGLEVWDAQTLRLLPRGTSGGGCSAVVSSPVGRRALTALSPMWLRVAIRLLRR